MDHLTSKYIGGHFYTIGPKLKHLLKPGAAPASIPWKRRVASGEQGDIYVTGRYSRVPSASTLVIIVHGLG